MNSSFDDFQEIIGFLLSKATDLQLYYNGLDLAGATKQKHHTIIHSALEAAVRLGYLTRNVSTLVPDKPKKDDVFSHDNCPGSAQGV